MAESMRHPDGSISIGTGTARRGEIVRCGIPIGHDLSGNAVAIPLIIIHGSEDGPVLWLNGATHGDEPEGAIATIKLLEAIDPAALRGTVVACPAMNVAALAASSRGDPADRMSYDMNRIYPGRADGYPTERVAAAHFAVMAPVCDLQINVHSGGTDMVIGELIFVPDTPASLELAAAMGPACPLIVMIDVEDGNPASQIAALGKAGIGIELGGLARSLTNDAHVVGGTLCSYVLNVLRHYGMIEGTASYAERWTLGHLELVLAPTGGLWLTEPSIDVLAEVPQGAPLGTLHSLHGEIVSEVIAPGDGVVAGIRARPQAHAGDCLAFFVAIDEKREAL